MTESNRYAQECKGELFTTWQPITVDELLAYMGFMMLMGLSGYQELKTTGKRMPSTTIHPWQIEYLANDLGNSTNSSTL